MGRGWKRLVLVIACCQCCQYHLVLVGVYKQIKETIKSTVATYRAIITASVSKREVESNKGIRDAGSTADFRML